MPRQLAILFPAGPTEYWLTARVFNVGDRIERHGTAYVVTSITTPDGHTVQTVDGDGRHATITVRPGGDASEIEGSRIALRRGIVSIPTSSRNIMLHRFRNVSSINDIVDVFQASGTTQPIRLTNPQKALLLNLLKWWGETDGGNGHLPEGISELLYALHDDLHHVGVEAPND